MMSTRQWGFRLALLALLMPLATTADDRRGSRFSSGPLVELIREATAPYHDAAVAEADGFVGGPCVSGRDGGAMGIHFVNADRLGDGQVNAVEPEVLIYEPQKNGRLRLVGVEFITFFDVWHAENGEISPTLEGHLFNYSGSPNRYAIPPFYELHVWAWRENPDGTFSDWNPRVSCDAQHLPAN